MNFFSDKFFQCLGVLASIFAIIFGSLCIPDLLLINKVLIATISSLTFIIGVLMFIIFQFRDRENTLISDYNKVYNYAVNLESEYKNLSLESEKLKENFSDTIKYVQALEGENQSLHNKLAEANKAIDAYRHNTLMTSLPNINNVGLSHASPLSLLAKNLSQ